MADITITVPPAQVDRVRTAFAKLTGKPFADVTTADVKAYIIADLKQLVRVTETRIAEEAVAPVDEIDVT